MNRIALVLFIISSLTCVIEGQFGPPLVPPRGRCGRGCVSPGECRVGYFIQRRWMSKPFDFCCYENGIDYKKNQDSPPEKLKLLDCRFRRKNNFAMTQAASDITYLDMSFNKIHHQADILRRTFLQYFPQLRSLKISLSHMNNIPSNFLAANYDLEHVDLSWNRLTEIPGNLFESNTELVKIELSGNRISTIPANLFFYTPNLEELVIPNNKLKYLTSEHFALNPELRYFDVSFNPDFECISPEIFRKAPENFLCEVGRDGVSYSPKTAEDILHFHMLLEHSEPHVGVENISAWKIPNIAGTRPLLEQLKGQKSYYVAYLITRFDL
uniref:Toll-like protein n=1 Tax=Boltenia villosa TaxID=63515 RepID=Q8MVN9_BOLVI|nr:toll-like protein [Boltenia villosa]